MVVTEAEFRLLFSALMERQPSDEEYHSLFDLTRGTPAEIVSVLCGRPEFIMKHPSFVPKPMTESLVSANANGIDLLVPSNDWVHWGTAQGWGWEPWVADAMREILSPGKVFVDIGANVGVLTLLGASLVGNAGKVFAIEASIENAMLILANVRHAKLTNTVILAIAASDKKGVEHITVDHGGTNKLVRTEMSDSAKFKYELVMTDTVDSMLSHLERVDLIKIDVEGREGSVLRGAKALLGRTRPKIIAEYHSSSPEPWYAKELVDQGYTMSVLTRDQGKIDLDQDLEAMTQLALETVHTKGTCLEILFAPLP